MQPPTSLEYPSLGDRADLALGQQVNAEPQVLGGATHFSIEPPLAEGLELDENEGTIEGEATALTDEVTHVITASNQAGSTTKKLTLAVVAPSPTDLSYPMASGEYAVDEHAEIEPDTKHCIACTFSVEPALPEGMAIDSKTGRISGTPVAVADEITYRVVAVNDAGSCDVEITFMIMETIEVDADMINVDFAAQLEAVTDITELMAEPSKEQRFGDWMVWMVHRAHLNDPTLTDFNFNNMHMPPPHLEERIAPKLVKAIAHNTNLQTLSLVNSNLMKTQGPELAESLKVNKTLKVLNLEANELDSEAVRVMGMAIYENRKCALESFRVTQQKQVGNFFGRPVEEAFGQMMEKNETITRLGFECNDPHWRNTIDRFLLRNNDFARRRRNRGSVSSQAEEIAAEEKALSRLVLNVAPEIDFSQVFPDISDPHKACLGFVADKRKYPLAAQLQEYSKGRGISLKYSVVAPTMKECRASLLDAAINTEVVVVDSYEAEVEGTLRRWTENAGNWNLDIWTSDGKRYAYRAPAGKELVLQVSEAWSTWLKSGT